MQVTFGENANITINKKDVSKEQWERLMDELGQEKSCKSVSFNWETYSVRKK